MDRRTLIVGIAAGLPALANAATPSLRERLLGSWRLLDAATVNAATGATRPWLGRPRPYAGLIVYTADGWMSVHIGAARPPMRADANASNLTPDEQSAIAQTWYGYYGRFEVDESTSRVRHHVEQAMYPFETGRTLVRQVHLDGDTLTLKTDNLAHGPDGDTYNVLSWAQA